MFLPWRVPDSRDAHERVFIERLDRIVHWARQIASGDTSLAEDLAQDAFLHFTTAKPPLADIGNLDKYLYAVLRNLHRSERASNSRRRAVSLDPLAHESAAQSWKSVDPERQLTLRQELFRLCVFVCQRTETSKGASAFLLHFFHGLSVTEVGVVMRTTRAAVDERLSVMRKEARRKMGKPTPLFIRPDAYGDADPMPGLRAVIASSRRGECFGHEELTRLYGPEATELHRERLAHLASCRICLAAVMQYLQLGRPGDSGSVPPVGVERTRITRWRRRREELLSIEPAELRLVVNGHVLATERVHRPDNDFSISVVLREPLDFLELWSGDDARLLFLPVLSEPPDGEFEQHAEIELKSGRLALNLRFTEPWPVIAVRYQMTSAESRAGAQAAPCVPPRVFLFERTQRPRGRFSIHLRIPAFSALIAVMLIVVLLFVQTRETTLSAAELLTKAGNWQMSVTTAQNPVLHRRFSLVLQSRGEPVRRTFVEVWRRADAAVKFSRWSDASGRVLAEARLTPKDLTILNQATVWEFDPSADAFKAAGFVDGATVSASAEHMIIRTSSAELTLDRASNRPIEERFLLSDGEYSFSEAATEIIPLGESPLSAPLAAAPRADRRVASIESRLPEMPVSSPVEGFEERELLVRRELHALKLATVATVNRHDAVIDVEFAPTSAEQERQVQIALERVPGVNLSILSPQLAVSRAVPAADSSVIESAQNKLQEPLATGWLKPVLGSASAIHAAETRRVETARRLVALVAELRLLAERYPASREGLLSADARRTLTEILEDLRAEIRSGIDEQKNAIALLGNLSVDPPAIASGKPCEAWQSQAMQAADTLWENEQAIEAFYAPVSTSGGSAADADVPIRLRDLTAILETMLPISCSH